MHLHIARVRRKGITYEYGQLVESFRRADGMPSQKVVANLGRLTSTEIANLRAAMKASREGRHVYVAKSDVPVCRAAKPVQNLRYLDVAVLLELWRRAGIGECLQELMPIRDAEVEPADVVCALVIQRCVDPGSKLYAERWFPRTALAELLGIAVRQFNNTRIHRVLDLLDKSTQRLMQRLPRLYDQEHKAVSAMFLDVTDTYFVGQGPALAQRGKTKEGFVRRKIGIVLLCNQAGWPLRWDVVAGKQGDAAAMHSLLNEVKGLDWIGQAPVVCDRSMGTSSEVRKLLRTRMRFLTALKVTEFAAYSDQIPHAVMEGLHADDDSNDAVKQCTREASTRAKQAGMTRASSSLYVLDLGVVERDRGTTPKRTVGAGGKLARALDVVRTIDSMLERGQATSYIGAARRLGVTKDQAKWYRGLRGLDASIAQQIIDGQWTTLSITKALKLSRSADPVEQRRRFAQWTATADPAVAARSVTGPLDAQTAGSDDAMPLRVRAVVYFNPERFVIERRHAEEALDGFQAFVQELNNKLARGGRKTERTILAEVDRWLRRKAMLDLFEITLKANKRSQGGACLQVYATLDTAKWKKRRRYDGFSLLVGHPELEQTAQQLCELYRAKDRVEKDFQTIKSMIRIRPMWHRTDPKVRAHVTLCILALLVERMLESRLSETTCAAAVETLSTCCLNRLSDGAKKSLYLVTEPDREQRALLRSLRLENLADDDEIAARIMPR